MKFSNSTAFLAGTLSIIGIGLLIGFAGLTIQQALTSAIVGASPSAMNNLKITSIARDGSVRQEERSILITTEAVALTLCQNKWKLLMGDKVQSANTRLMTCTWGKQVVFYRENASFGRSSLRYVVYEGGKEIENVQENMTYGEAKKKCESLWEAEEAKMGYRYVNCQYDTFTLLNKAKGFGSSQNNGGQTKQTTSTSYPALNFSNTTDVPPYITYTDKTSSDNSNTVSKSGTDEKIESSNKNDSSSLDLWKDRKYVLTYNLSYRGDKPDLQGTYSSTPISGTEALAACQKLLEQNSDPSNMLWTISCYWGSSIQLAVATTSSFSNWKMPQRIGHNLDHPFVKEITAIATVEYIVSFPSGNGKTPDRISQEKTTLSREEFVTKICEPDYNGLGVLYIEPVDYKCKYNGTIAFQKSRGTSVPSNYIYPMSDGVNPYDNGGLFLDYAFFKNHTGNDTYEKNGFRRTFTSYNYIQAVEVCRQIWNGGLAARIDADAFSCIWNNQLIGTGSKGKEFSVVQLSSGLEEAYKKLGIWSDTTSNANSDTSSGATDSIIDFGSAPVEIIPAPVDPNLKASMYMTVLYRNGVQPKKITNIQTYTRQQAEQQCETEWNKKIGANYSYQGKPNVNALVCTWNNQEILRKSNGFPEKMPIIYQLHSEQKQTTKETYTYLEARTKCQAWWEEEKQKTTPLKRYLYCGWDVYTHVFAGEQDDTPWKDRKYVMRYEVWPWGGDIQKETYGSTVISGTEALAACQKILQVNTKPRMFSVTCYWGDLGNIYLASAATPSPDMTMPSKIKTHPDHPFIKEQNTENPKATVAVEYIYSYPHGKKQDTKEISTTTLSREDSIKDVCDQMYQFKVQNNMEPVNFSCKYNGETIYKKSKGWGVVTYRYSLWNALDGFSERDYLYYEFRNDNNKYYGWDSTHTPYTYTQAVEACRQMWNWAQSRVAHPGPLQCIWNNARIIATGYKETGFHVSEISPSEEKSWKEQGRW